MAKIYANLIIAKRRTIDSVPENIRAAVVEELKSKGYDENGNPIAK